MYIESVWPTYTTDYEPRLGYVFVYVGNSEFIPFIASSYINRK